MRYWIGFMLLAASAAAWADEAQMKQWAKMDRCSNAASVVVSIIEETSDTFKQALALQGAINGLKTNSKLGEATPTPTEVSGSYNMALRISAGVPRPFGKRDHDWLIAQSASACSLWIPDAKPE
ncbi:hypothetical protein ABEH28_10625 [Pseudomonas sp. Ps21-P2]|uniref:hypothetical protein n=1 Tax=Pseudomonas sp. Ps21-P2 TaxID=3080331 RepID=UPI00320B0322